MLSTLHETAFAQLFLSNRNDCFGTVKFQNWEMMAEGLQVLSMWHILNVCVIFYPFANILRFLNRFSPEQHRPDLRLGHQDTSFKLFM